MTLENRIPPPFLVPLFGAAMWAAALIGPQIQPDRNVRIVAAVVLALPSLLILSAGFLTFRRAKTTIDPVRIDRASTVVTTGIFRYTRNPMYVAFTGFLLAWAVYLAVPWALFGPAFYVLFLTRFQIIPEERAMSTKFGGQYEQYRNQVRRWL